MIFSRNQHINIMYPNENYPFIYNFYEKVLNHIENAVVDLVEQVKYQPNPIPAIMTETIHSLNFCRKKSGG